MESTNVLLVLAFCKVGTCIQVVMCKHCVRRTVTFTELLDDGVVRSKYVGGILLKFDCNLRRLCT